MNLQPGCPLVVAPRFYLTIDWQERLLLGSIEEEAGQFAPGLAWRAPTADEQAMLVGDPSRLTKDDVLARGLCLFKLPEHLQSSWWAMLEQAQQSATQHLPGFDHFVQEIARFLAFKELAVPAGAIFDVVLSKPGQRAISWNAQDGVPTGSLFHRAPPCWGGVNLSDEPLSLLLVNRTIQQLHSALADRLVDRVPLSSPGELAMQLLTHCRDHPLVRLRLEPGEGYRTPAEGMLIDACTLDMQVPAMLLLVRAAPTA